MVRLRGPAAYALWAGFALSVTALVVGLFTRDVKLLVSFLVPISAISLIAIVLLVVQRRKDPVWLREQWLTYNAQPKAAIATAVVLTSATILAGVLGVGLLSIGYLSGWALLLGGAASAVLIAFHLWVALRPVDDTDNADRSTDV